MPAHSLGPVPSKCDGVEEGSWATSSTYTYPYMDAYAARAF